MIKRVIFCLLFALLFLTACLSNGGSVEKTVGEEEEKPEKLVVYLNASSHTFVSQESGKEVFTYYPSTYSLGTMPTGGEFNSLRGNIFEQALAEYAEQTGIPIEVHYVEEYVGDSDVFQVMLDHGEPLPDLMVLTKAARYDYTLLAQQGYLLDFTPYAESDETLQDGERYYQAVLDGGRIKQKQYTLPILFNLNGIITSQSFLDYVGAAQPGEYPAYEEVLQMLYQSCLGVKDNRTLEALYEYSGWMPAGRYIPSILLGAAYPSYEDEVSGKVYLESATLQSILDVMQAYNEQEFAPIPGWETNSYMENSNHSLGKTFMMQRTAEDAERVGVFLSGGRSGGSVLHNSLLMDLAFFNSVYDRQGEQLVFCGIPTINRSDEYAAIISLCALGAATTEYPQAVYELARYLMDYTYAPGYGFSVNREITDAQLENMQTTTTHVFPNHVWSQVTGNFRSYEEVEQESFEVQPLDQEWVEKIRFMLDHMAGAGLPSGVLEYYLLSYAQTAVGSGELTSAEGAQWVLSQWEQYQQMRPELEPFYDKEYVLSLLWAPADS